MLWSGFKARQRGTRGEFFAVKVVACDKWAAHEAKILRTLEHQNICKLHEYFTCEQEGVACLVMQFASGGNLLERVVHGGALSEVDCDLSLLPPPATGTTLPQLRSTGGELAFLKAWLMIRASKRRMCKDSRVQFYTQVFKRLSRESWYRTFCPKCCQTFRRPKQGN